MHAAVLRGDASAGPCGDNEEGQCDLPAPVAVASYGRVAAGARQTAELRGAGSAVACCGRELGECDLEAPVADVSYTQAAAERASQPRSGAMPAPRTRTRASSASTTSQRRSPT